MELFGLLIVVFLVASLILPWVNLVRLNGQRRELETLRYELEELEAKQDRVARSALPVKPESQSEPKSEPNLKPESKPAPRPEPQGAVGPPPLEAGSKQSGPVAGMAAGTREVRTSDAVRRSASLKVGAGITIDDEPASEPGPGLGANTEIRDPGNGRLPSGSALEPQDWFSKLAVWVGGIALLMAGFYMIKYSIDSGWLTPLVRIWLTAGFGGLLCATGFFISTKSTQAANERIGQALAGAGIACLYFAAYAAVHLYGLLSSGQGFVAMLAVTALAVVLSLRNGAPIAMMGLGQGLILVLIGGCRASTLWSGGVCQLPRHLSSCRCCI
ncbi:MAG: DUF2339 domain-containing protein [Puniceicoccaceae bacterium]|nr:MAG: DUF2339 domain-containing protein [Puniceicoccaceae bacterium]